MLESLAFSRAKILIFLASIARAIPTHLYKFKYSITYIYLLSLSTVVLNSH